MNVGQILETHMGWAAKSLRVLNNAILSSKKAMIEKLENALSNAYGAMTLKIKGLSADNLSLNKQC